MYHLSCHRFLIAYDSSFSVKALGKFHLERYIQSELMSEVHLYGALMDREVSYASSTDNLANRIVVDSIVYS